jgi:hypothetical protein
MFGKIGRGWKAGKISSEVIMLLMKNYGMQANKRTVDDIVARRVDFLPNAHDLAIMYLADQVIYMDESNPAHVGKAEKFVRVAKQATNVGATIDDGSVQELCDIVESKFGLDTKSIEPKPL